MGERITPPPAALMSPDQTLQPWSGRQELESFRTELGTGAATIRPNEMSNQSLLGMGSINKARFLGGGILELRTSVLFRRGLECGEETLSPALRARTLHSSDMNWNPSELNFAQVLPPFNQMKCQIKVYWAWAQSTKPASLAAHRSIGGCLAYFPFGWQSTFCSCASCLSKSKE